MKKTKNIINDQVLCWLKFTAGSMLSVKTTVVMVLLTTMCCFTANAQTPVVACSNSTGVLDANGEFILTAESLNQGSYYVDGTGQQITTGLEFSFDPNDKTANTINLTCGDVGATVYEIWAWNGAQPSNAGCEVTFTLTDETAPTLVALSAASIDLDGTSNTHTITAADVLDSYGDNCNYLLDFNPATVDCSNVLAPVDVVVTATDGFNVTEITVPLTVKDVTPPTGTCDTPIDVYLDTNGEYTLTQNDINALSGVKYDDCDGAVTASGTLATFTCADLTGNPHDITITLTDESGNTNTCTGQVIVKDEVVPSLTTKDNITVSLDVTTNEVTILPSDVIISSDDNCGIVNTTLSNDTFTCADVTSTANPAKIITITVEDASGNTTSEDVEVIVLDEIDPTPVCIGIDVILDATGNYELTTSDMEAIGLGSIDNCTSDSDLTFAVSPNTFDCTQAGIDVQVTLTVTDASGNSADCTAMVSVIDNTTPTLITKTYTAVLGTNDEVTIVADDVIDTTSDNCPTVKTLSQDVFTCADVTLPGQTGNIITVTVTEDRLNGNTTSETAEVIVLDQTNPTPALNNNIEIALDATGNYTLTAADIDAIGLGSTDNCTNDSDLIFAVSPNTFDCTQVDEQVAVTLTVTDASGNTATAPATVLVKDVTKPTASCKDVTINLSEGLLGVYTLNASELNDNSSDECSTTLEYRVNGAATLDVDCAYLGAGQVVDFTVVDESGNESDPCQVTIRALDDIAPTMVCQSEMQVPLNNQGKGYVVGQDLISAFSITDECTDPLTVTVNDQAFVEFGCENVGDNNIVVKAIDDAGNITQCNVVIKVLDNVPPTVVTKDIAVDLDASGSITIEAGDVNDGSSDICGIATYELDNDTFGCDNVGTNTVTLTVTDVNGNSATETAIVTVSDVTSPTVNTQDITVELDATGTVTIAAEDVNNASTDACGIATYALDNDTFDCSNVGANTVELTVTDIHGNSASETAIVTVKDVTAPEVVTKNIMVELDPTTGKVTIEPEDVDDGSSDICGIATVDGYTLDISEFDCSKVGDNTVTLTVTDVNGNTNTGTATVTVKDVTNPTVITKDITVILEATGTVTIEAEDVNDGSSDLCGIATYALDNDTFDCTNLGTNTVTLTVTDVNGNTNSDTAIVTVVDETAPTVNTQDITVELDATGAATITTDQIDNNSTDACGIATYALDITEFDCSNVGANTVTLTVTDVNGNSNTGTATVTVKDLIVPNVVTQDITVSLGDDGKVSISEPQIENGSTDACGISTYALDITEFDCSNVGANTVTLTVTDVNGNEGKGTATVTVEDNTPPTVVTQDITVELDMNGQATITVEDINNASTDACGISTYALDNDTFDCTNLGENTVTLKVTDVNGNENIATATVTVIDVITPLVNCNDNVEVPVNQDGMAFVTKQAVMGDSYDNCTITESVIIGAGQEGDAIFFDCSNTGEIPVTVRVTDQSGNVAECNTYVVVKDEVVPQVQCVGTHILNLEEDGTVALDAKVLDAGSTDNCTDAADLKFSVDKAVFDCDDVGSNTVTLTVEDAAGNTNTCTVAVTVLDTVKPSVVTQDIIVQLDANGAATITTDQIDNNSTDACGIATYALDITEFDCSNVGENTVELTVTDNNGNSQSGTAIVTVQDLVKPSVVTQDITVQLDANGAATITTDQIDNNSTDACGIATYALDIDVFDCSNVGENTVVLTVTDVNGNSDTAEAVVTVKDVTAPNVITKTIDVNLDATGTVTIAAGDVNNASTDACGIATYALDNDTFDCSNVGANTVTLTVTDIHGNSSSNTATVNVHDVTAPNVVTQDITIELDANGAATITTDQIDNNSTDACGLATYALDITEFDCSNVGDNTVTLTVTDVNGNTNSDTAIVTVVDVTNPVVNTQDITVELDATGTVTIAAEEVNNASEDACGIDPEGFSLDIDTFTCSNVGENTVTLTVTDVNGNTNIGTAIVTVNDTTVPEVLTQDITVELDANGAATITADQIDNNSTDACGIATYALDIDAFDCSNVGENTVELSVTDNNGNSASNTAVVTVEDNLGPVITCPADVSQYTVSTDCNQNVYLPEFTSQDNCTATTHSYEAESGIVLLLDGSGATYGLFPVGVTPVKAVSVDAYGNRSECTFNVEVLDNIAPTIDCSAIGTIVVDTANGACEATVSWDESKIDATDNCIQTNQGLTVTSDIESGSTFPVGTTTVTYTATDAAGNTATCSFDVTVNEVNPVADFTSSVNVNEVMFTNTSMNATSYTWDFGDGNTSTDANPTHNYIAGGTYNVCLEVENECGTVDQICKDVIVVGGTPDLRSAFKYSPSVIASGETANVSINISNTGDVATTGEIRVLIFNPSSGTLNLTLPTGWTENNFGSYRVLTTSNVVNTGLANRVTITGNFVHNGVITYESVYTSLRILPNSGGESNSSNNNSQGGLTIR